MTDQHPITPPPELIQQWLGEFFGCTVYGALSDSERYLATQAARWGSDQELEACCEWFVRDWTDIETADKLRAARRPKPKSQVEEALDLLDRIEYNHMTKNLGNEKAWDIKELEAVRAALERLRELEKSND
jgi:hypothetical protein